MTALSSCSRFSSSSLDVTWFARSGVSTNKVFIFESLGNAPPRPPYILRNRNSVPAKRFSKLSARSSQRATNGNTNIATLPGRSRNRRINSKSATRLLPPLVGALYNKFTRPSITPGRDRHSICHGYNSRTPFAASASRADSGTPQNSKSLRPVAVTGRSIDVDASFPRLARASSVVLDRDRADRSALSLAATSASASSSTSSNSVSSLSGVFAPLCLENRAESCVNPRTRSLRARSSDRSALPSSRDAATSTRGRFNRSSRDSLENASFAARRRAFSSFSPTVSRMRSMSMISGSSDRRRRDRRRAGVEPGMIDARA